MFFDLLNRLIYGDIFTSDDDEDEVMDTPPQSFKTDLRRISQTTFSKKYEIDIKNAIHVWNKRHLPVVFFEWMEENNIPITGLMYLMLVPDSKYSLIDLDNGLELNSCRPVEYFVGKTEYIARLYYSDPSTEEGQP